MADEDEEARGRPRTVKLKKEDVSALPAQLGKQLRTLFSDIETQPVPDRLRELLEQLAQKEEKPE